MNTADIVNLYRYNEWANHRLTGATTGLAVDALTRNLGGSYKCIRDVLAHIISVEWVWFERWNGVSPTSVPDWVAGDVAVLTTHLSDVEARRARFLEELTDSYLKSEVSFQLLSGAEGREPLQDLLLHVVDHSTYHRGQLASMLRQVGAVPPATGFITFKSETRQS